MAEDKTKMRELIGQTISHICFNGASVKIYNESGDLILWVDYSHLYDGDGFRFDASEHGWILARIAPGAN